VAIGIDHIISVYSPVGPIMIDPNVCDLLVPKALSSPNM
jgi:hypothetical protein